MTRSVATTGEVLGFNDDTPNPAGSSEGLESYLEWLCPATGTFGAHPWSWS